MLDIYVLRKPHLALPHGFLPLAGTRAEDRLYVCTGAECGFWHGSYMVARLDAESADRSGVEGVGRVIGSSLPVDAQGSSHSHFLEAIYAHHNPSCSMSLAVNSRAVFLAVLSSRSSP